MKTKIKKGVCFGCTRLFSYADKGTERRFCNKKCYVEFIKKPTKVIRDERVVYKNMFLLTAYMIALVWFCWFFPELTPLILIIFGGVVFYRKWMK